MTADSGALLFVSDLADDGGQLLKPFQQVEPRSFRQLLESKVEVVECIVKRVSEVGHTSRVTPKLGLIPRFADECEAFS